MAIVYEIKINGARVHDQGELTDVVKELDVTMKGTDAGCSFELPFVVKLGPADEESFTAFESLTEAEMVAWVEAQEETLSPYHAHIAMVVAKEVEKAALSSKPLPWAPVPTPAPEPAPAPIEP